MGTTDMDVAIRELAGRVRGPVLTPGDDGFEHELAGFNVATHHTPAVVVGAEDAQDVAAAVRFAAAHDLPVAVQATGHGAVLAFDRGVLVGTRRMQHLSIDPERRLATVGAGVKWRKVIDAAAPHGLGTLNGSSSDVGVVGYTLGGGLPVLGRTFGFASDRVVAADVVVADGSVVHVTADSEPELFWALKGGKASVGIVTSLTFELVPVAEIYGGGIFFPGEAAPEVLDAYRSWTHDLPDAMTTAVGLLRLPDMPSVPEPLRGKMVTHLKGAFVGDPAEGEALVAPMRAVAPAIADEFRVMSYTEVDTIHHDPEVPLPFRETVALLEDLTPEAVAGILAVAGPGVNTPLMMADLRHLGGALGRGPAADAVGARDALYSLFFLGLMVPPVAEAVPGALVAAVAEMAPYTTGRTFVNLHGTPASEEDRARAWPQDTYRRLRAVKHRFDPEDRFRFAHSVSPLPLPS